MILSRTIIALNFLLIYGLLLIRILYHPKCSWTLYLPQRTLIRLICSTITSSLSTLHPCHAPFHLPLILCRFSMTSMQISHSDIHTALTHLDPSKAIGIDGFGPQILRSCADALCTPLHHLFTTSLQYFTIPSQWKIHRIIPIFKSGDKTVVSNYRPISLCTVSKVLRV